MATKTVRESYLAPNDAARLEGASRALSSCIDMSHAINALFEAADIADILCKQSNAHDVFPIFNAIELCLEKIMNESREGYDRIEGMALRGVEAIHV